MDTPLIDILAAVISLEGDEGALRAAECLAHTYNAHATALVLTVHPGSDFAETIVPLSVVLEDLARGPQGEAARIQAEIEAWVAKSDIDFEVRALQIENALRDRQVLAYARHADLTVLTKPNPHRDVGRRLTWESVLFGAGRPVLLVRSNWSGDALGRRILIAWNAKREASRAVCDAMPFIVRADAVVVATVDAMPSADGHGERPGHDLALHLARHGAKVEVENLDGLGRAAGLRLLEAARAINADMIVMGGYGHARAAEWLLGGVTREMIEFADIPLLMSH
jgi:nucleotide-binding universal stress UspA family protein